MEEKLQAHQVEIDPDFEPQSRPRSCTWPLPHPDFAAEEEDGGAPGAPPALAAGGGEGAENAAAPAERRAAAAASLPPPGVDVGQLRKAKTSRRNAWGNLSYADLITKAIESSPEKRLTLSQIYDWMVRYVPYFKDKGDSNSSAGWKVCAVAQASRPAYASASFWPLGEDRLRGQRFLPTLVLAKATLEVILLEKQRWPFSMAPVTPGESPDVSQS